VGLNQRTCIADKFLTIATASDWHGLTAKKQYMFFTPHLPIPQDNCRNEWHDISWPYRPMCLDVFSNKNPACDELQLPLRACSFVPLANVTSDQEWTILEPSLVLADFQHIEQQGESHRTCEGGWWASPLCRPHMKIF